MRFFFLIIAGVSLAFGQPATIHERMHAVESGLMPRVVLKGRPMPRFALDERMQALLCAASALR